MITEERGTAALEGERATRSVRRAMESCCSEGCSTCRLPLMLSISDDLLRRLLRFFLFDEEEEEEEEEEEDG